MIVALDASPVSLLTQRHGVADLSRFLRAEPWQQINP
jgi:hypothetical protein